MSNGEKLRRAHVHPDALSESWKGSPDRDARPSPATSSLPLENNQHLATLAFPGALCLDDRVVGQRQMHDTPLVGGHGLQSHRLARALHLLCHAKGKAAHRGLPSL